MSDLKNDLSELNDFWESVRRAVDKIGAKIAEMNGVSAAVGEVWHKPHIENRPKNQVGIEQFLDGKYKRQQEEIDKLNERLRIRVNKIVELEAEIQRLQEGNARLLQINEEREAHLTKLGNAIISPASWAIVPKLEYENGRPESWDQ
jgi:predicted RNase H-like nuclease (RuvC/YqgF family)